jgi:hypothetical protein
VSAAEGVSARLSSESNEHFTPPHIVEAARATLGGIDLDPFSCRKANETVKAAMYFFDTSANPSSQKSADGFLSAWHGRVFVNPPGGRGPGNESNQKRAWFKLASEYNMGRVTAGIFVCFSVEMLQTTQVKTPPGLPLPLDFPICYPSKRVAYIREDGEVGASPPHSSCIIYVPPQPWIGEPVPMRRFRDAFAAIGRVVVPS